MANPSPMQISTPAASTSVPASYAASIPTIRTELNSILTRAEEEIKAGEQSLQQKVIQLEKKQVEIEERSQRQIEHGRQIKEEQYKLEEDRKAQRDRLYWEKDDLAKEKADLDKVRTRCSDIVRQQNPITVEVGGDKFHTQVGTLVKHENSIFPDLVKTLQSSRQQRSPSQPNANQRHTIFIDRDGKHFKFILNFMRQGEEVIRGTALRNADEYVLNEILSEVRYYKLSDLERLLERRKVANKKERDFNFLITSRYFVQIKPQAGATAVYYKYKTAKEIVIKGENLTGIVFDRVVFEHSISFEGCVLVGAIFRECSFRGAVNLKNADLYRAKFEHCEGMKLSEHFYMDKANMKDVTFDPPLVRSD